MALVTEQIAVHLNTINMSPYTPNVMMKASGNVRINTRPIITSVDTLPTHSRTSPAVTHAAATFVALGTVDKFRVNGQPVILDGDEATCLTTHTISASSGGVNFTFDDGEE